MNYTILVKFKVWLYFYVNCLAIQKILDMIFNYMLIKSETIKLIENNNLQTDKKK